MKKNHTLTHCKKCQGVILREVEIKDMIGKVSFKIKCPHCTEEIQVTIDTIYDYVIKVE